MKDVHTTYKHAQRLGSPIFGGEMYSQTVIIDELYSP